MQMKKEEKIKKLEDICPSPCVWKFYAEGYWDPKSEYTKKCLECRGDKKYCKFYKNVS